MATVTASDIYDRFSIVLQDVDGVRWTETEFLDWLNSGQRAIASLRPDSSVTRSSVALVAGTKQSLPASALALVDITRNMGADGNTPGRGIVPYSKEILDRAVPTWHTLEADEVALYCYDSREPKVFWVYPAQPSPPVQQVEMATAIAPADVAALINTISIDDNYEGPLLDYCLYRALSKDGEDATQLNRATGYRQSYLQALGIQGQAEEAIAPGGNQ